MESVAMTETTCKLPVAVAADLRVVLAALQAKKPQLADVLSRANAVLLAGRLFPGPDGQEALVSSHDPEGNRIVYHVGEHCDCPATTNHPDEVCKHVYAFELWKIVQKRLARQAPREEDAPATSAELEDTPRIPRKFLQKIQGKDFVRYEGLLAMAHERGLQALTACIEFHSETLILASATATFQDGQTFTEWGDATLENVREAVRPHWIRMALTRAKARCLRDALNIAMCSVEELE